MKMAVGLAVILIMIFAGIKYLSGDQLGGIYFMLIAILFQLFNVEET